MTELHGRPTGYEPVELLLLQCAIDQSLNTGVLRKHPQAIAWKLSDSISPVNLL